MVSASMLLISSIAFRVIVNKGETQRKAMLEINSIDAETIQLVHTRANLVKGTDVRIGAGCEIVKLEYAGDLTIEEGATVRQQVKVDE